MLDSTHRAALRDDVEAIHRLSAELTQRRDDFDRHAHEAQVAGATLEELAEALDGLPLLGTQLSSGRSSAADRWKPGMIGNRTAAWRNRHNIQIGRGSGNKVRAQHARDQIAAQGAAIAAGHDEGAPTG